MKNNFPIDITKQIKPRDFSIGLEAYIELHKRLAEKSLLDLPVIVQRLSMVSDGWMDDMMVLTAVVENKLTHKISKIKWSDRELEWKEMII